MRLTVCDVCAELHRYSAHDTVTVGALLLSPETGCSTGDDLQLIAEGWQIADGRHYCPEHYPTAQHSRVRLSAV